MGHVAHPGDELDAGDLEGPSPSRFVRVSRLHRADPMVRSGVVGLAVRTVIVRFERCRPLRHRLRAVLCTLSTHDSVGV